MGSVGEEGGGWQSVKVSADWRYHEYQVSTVSRRDIAS